MCVCVCVYPQADEYQSQVSGLQKEASDAKAEVDRLTKEVEKQRAAKHLALKQVRCGMVSMYLHRCGLKLVPWLKTLSREKDAHQQGNLQVPVRYVCVCVCVCVCCIYTVAAIQGHQGVRCHRQTEG